MCMFNEDGTWNPNGECDGCGACVEWYDDSEYDPDEDW